MKISCEFVCSRNFPQEQQIFASFFPSPHPRPTTIISLWLYHEPIIYGITRHEDDEWKIQNVNIFPILKFIVSLFCKRRKRGKSVVQRRSKRWDDRRRANLCCLLEKIEIVSESGEFTVTYLQYIKSLVRGAGEEKIRLQNFSTFPIALPEHRITSSQCRQITADCKISSLERSKESKHTMLGRE